MKSQVSEQFENVRYNYRLLSGQAVLEISGAVKLKSVLISRATSGEKFTIFDSAISGRFLSAGVSVIGMPYCGSEMESPKQLDFDVGLNSGLVIVSSGANWVITTTYK